MILGIILIIIAFEIFAVMMSYFNYDRFNLNDLIQFNIIFILSCVIIGLVVTGVILIEGAL